MSAPGVVPFTTRLAWRFEPPAPPGQCAAALRLLLDELGAVERAVPGAVVGHIKAFALLPGGGWLRGSAISARRAADVELSAGAATPVGELLLDLAVLVAGGDAAACGRHYQAVLAAHQQPPGAGLAASSPGIGPPAEPPVGHR